MSIGEFNDEFFSQAADLARQPLSDFLGAQAQPQGADSSFFQSLSPAPGVDFAGPAAQDTSGSDFFGNLGSSFAQAGGSLFDSIGSLFSNGDLFSKPDPSLYEHSAQVAVADRAAAAAAANPTKTSSSMAGVRPPSGTGYVEPNRASPWYQKALAAAQAAGIDPELFARQISWESGGFDESVINGTKRSTAGAVGIAQFAPGTAASLGINPLNPDAALAGAARLMATYLKQFGNYRDALIAYNAGPGAVGSQLLPQETQTYLKNIMGDPTQATNTVVPGAYNPSAPVSGTTAAPPQFQSGLPPDIAIAACGPVAVTGALRQLGINADLTEVVQRASNSRLWDTNVGMHGPQSTAQLAQSYGVNVIQQAPDAAQLLTELQSGKKVIIDTPGHLFLIEGYDPSTGKFDFGNSASALKASGGNTWYTLDEISRLGMGAARAALIVWK